jgi:SAM-dependent methyltransferase
MLDRQRELEINQAAWDRVAPLFFGGTALPQYGPLAPTENELNLLDARAQKVLELGCGSGHSLRYLAERGATELWGIDLSAGANCLCQRDAPAIRLDLAFD